MYLLVKYHSFLPNFQRKTLFTRWCKLGQLKLFFSSCIARKKHSVWKTLPGLALAATNQSWGISWEVPSVTNNNEHSYVYVRRLGVWGHQRIGRKFGHAWIIKQARLKVLFHQGKGWIACMYCSSRTSFNIQNYVIYKLWVRYCMLRVSKVQDF